MKKEIAKTYALIEIHQIREKDERKEMINYKDLRWCVELKMGNLTKSFCEPTLKKLFNRIKEELFI